MSQVELETRSPKSATDLKELAQDLVRRAMQGGATAAECVVREGDEFSTLVRLGQVETLKEAGSRAIGVRVFHGQRSASTHSSDFSREGLDRMLKSALELARITSEDPFSGIPEPSQLGSLSGDLDLYSADVYSLPGEERISYARRAEKAALDYDARIKNSDGGSFDAATGHKVLANSHGFVGEYRRSYCSVAAVPIAQDEKGGMQRDYWFSVARSLNRLESAEEVGKIAAQRTLRRLGARKVKTAHVPVVFDPLVATSILGHIFEGVNGDSVYRGASFLAGKLGEKIAADQVTVIDDGTMVGGFGTSPFDGEGIPDAAYGGDREWSAEILRAEYLHGEETGPADHRATPLADWLARRGSVPAITSCNLERKLHSRSSAKSKKACMSPSSWDMGANLVTGDYSRGASGLWISGGELTYPVEEITVAGNLKEMFKNISEIANDLEFRGAVASPTIRIDGLTVGGE